MHKGRRMKHTNKGGGGQRNILSQGTNKTLEQGGACMHQKPTHESHTKIVTARHTDRRQTQVHIEVVSTST